MTGLFILTSTLFLAWLARAFRDATIMLLPMIRADGDEQ